jgi:DNA-binding MarR family transcriptional regulator
MTSHDISQYENCLCGNLRKAARLVSQAYGEALKPYDLTAGQFTTLAVLSHFPGGAPVSELAQRMGLDRTTLTRNAAHLERAGLIESRVVPDKRVRRLAVTDKGRAVIGKARAAWLDQQNRLAGRLGAADTANLLDLLTRFATAVSAPESANS